MALLAEARATSTDRWRHDLAARFAGLHGRALPGSDTGPVGVRGALAARALGEVGVFAVAGTAQQVERTTGAARQEPLDLLKVCLMTSGTAVVEQEGTQLAVGPGEFAVYDTGRPYALTLRPDWTCLVMTVPRCTLGLPEPTLRRVLQRAHGTRGPGRLLAGFLHDAVTADAGSAAAAWRLGEAGVALLAGAVADDGLHAGDLAADELRHRVVAWVRSHLHEDDLSVAAVARALHLSPRSLQRLFEGEELGVAGLVRELRLEAVRRDLGDPALADRTIAWIAARHGVTDAPWLSRAFRARYGRPPSALRASTG